MLYVMLLLSTLGLTQDQWICQVDSTQIVGGDVAACGVGDGVSEGTARSLAFESAKREFDSICGPDTECGMHKYAVEPKRTTCERVESYWKCYRMVVFKLVSEPRREIASRDIIPTQSPAIVGLSNQERLDRILGNAMSGR